VAFREVKSALGKAKEESLCLEGEVKELQAQLKYQNEQTFKYQEQVRNVMMKIADYE